ncbi:MAG: biotin--[acetyl-CoA-carboxylase] ligase [Candidatus Omnitrophota bacterium]
MYTSEVYIGYLGLGRIMVNEEILYFLKKRPGYVSGEDISGHLGISRAAVWKHIQELKDLDYDIAAVPHLGYELLSCPDRLFPWEIKYHLESKFIAKDIHYYESLPSTMDKAMDLALSGAPEGALVLSEGQTKGRGRMGRQWQSPQYKGIYFSLIIKPKILPQQASLFTLISAVVICGVLKKHLGLEAQIKWPNDILVNNKKIAGILTELSAEMDIVHAIIIGIGINVNNEKKSLPYASSSLRELTGNEVNRLSLLQSILRCFEEEYLRFQKQGAKQILDDWRNLSATLGRRVRLSMSGMMPRITGEAVDIDHDGGLLVRQDSGLIERVVSGDIIHCKR